MAKTVLITGAASGFGRGVALGLARAGHDVIAACHIWPQVTELRAAAKAEGLDLRVIKLDVLSEIDRNHALALDFDVLFNNAGIMESGPVVELPAEIVRRIFDTNVFAALEMAQGAVKKFIKKGAGRIVWTSSVAGLVKVPWAGPIRRRKTRSKGSVWRCAKNSPLTGCRSAPSIRARSAPVSMIPAWNRRISGGVRANASWTIGRCAN